MVAALPAGVLDAAYVSDAVGSLVEECGEHWFSTAAATFAADEQLGQADRVHDVVRDPAIGREVAELEGAGGYADAARAEGDDDVGHIMVSPLDGGPSRLQCCDEPTGVQGGVDS